MLTYNEKCDASKYDASKCGTSFPLRWSQLRLRPAPSARFGHSLSVVSAAAPAPSASEPMQASAVIMFGGCVESGSGGFLAALGRTYVQTGEAWALDLSTFRFACYRQKMCTV